MRSLAALGMTGLAVVAEEERLAASPPIFLPFTSSLRIVIPTGGRNLLGQGDLILYIFKDQQSQFNTHNITLPPVMFNNSKNPNRSLPSNPSSLSQEHPKTSLST
jgi:hypothetical protein